mgnify:FL=1
MFTLLKHIIPRTTEKYGLHRHISALNTKEKIEKTIRDVIKKEVRVVKQQGKRVVVRGESFSVANELRLRGEDIKKRLQKENIHIDEIRHSL